ncbi:dynein axonemal heavy chain 2-like [Gopherus flavomarginatus]|uniref:dynein axonemal heavy chain 2-like n=1 Tax=Gopherus flavomarginatus TaxID=286002 RepID=UPI0021CC2A42|nr:dynein axonemal heavy chain 2-like [Gopherus flavomarginatus]
MARGAGRESKEIDVWSPLSLSRCYITLMTALHLHWAGSPKGPAGTGKTATVKDLGKALRLYVIILNCSEGLDYKSMGSTYSGLAQTGAWGCFDEFNRINIEMQSVVAQQILSILSALGVNITTFTFEAHKIKLVWSCGNFITMNPGGSGQGYWVPWGRAAQQLKSIFCPNSMVVPNSTLIAEIILFREGFSNCKLLAEKIYTLYSLAVQQLSKQDHYDFGLQVLTSLLRYAEKQHRVHLNINGEEVCDCLQHFARWEDGTQTPLPCSFGHWGPQMTQNLLEREETFQKHLHTLRNRKGGSLDLFPSRCESPQPCDARVRSGVKDLEVMAQNLITSAFETGGSQAAHGLFQKLKLSRKVKDWNREIIETSKVKVEQFKRTMPLLSDLRNPALQAHLRSPSAPALLTLWRVAESCSSIA